MSRVGCGYVALGGLAHRDPAELKRIARERLGILRPIALYDYELVRLAREIGMQAGPVTEFNTGLRPTLASLVRKMAPGRYVFLSCNHFVGVYKGKDGTCAYFNTLGRKSSRMRVVVMIPLKKEGE